MRLTVVAPVYQEEKGILHFYERTRAVLDTLTEVEATIIFVVDRCRDRSLEILRSVTQRDTKVRVLALSARFGHQASLLAGISNALDADAIVMMDSDLQHPPELIPEMLHHFYEGIDVVYTVRRNNSDSGIVRKHLGAFFYALINRLSSVDIPENTADFRLISHRVACVLAHSIQERNLFLRGLVAWMGFPQVGLEYSSPPRFAGNSKYTFYPAMRLAIYGLLSFSAKPLQVGLLCGIIFSCVSFFYAMILSANYFIDKSLPSGWTTLSILILLATGIQLIVSGIIGIYVGGVYNEVKKRPLYLIQEDICHKTTGRESTETLAP